MSFDVYKIPAGRPQELYNVPYFLNMCLFLAFLNKFWLTSISDKNSDERNSKTCKRTSNLVFSSEMYLSRPGKRGCLEDRISKQKTSLRLLVTEWFSQFRMLWWIIPVDNKEVTSWTTDKLCKYVRKHLLTYVSTVATIWESTKPCLHAYAVK